MEMARATALLASIVLLVGLSLVPRHGTDVASADPTTRPSSRSSAEVGSRPATDMSEAALKKLLLQLEKEFGGIRSLQAEFVQEKHLSVFEDVALTRGVCLFLHPKSIRFEIQEPFRSIVVADGKHAAKYEHIEGKWQRLNMPESEALLVVMNQIAAWLQGDFSQQTGIYDIRGRQAECASVILIPRHKALLKIISSIELRLDKDNRKFTSVTMREPGGDHSVMRFVSEQRNADLAVGLFDVSAKVPVDCKKLDSTPGATSRPASGASGEGTAERQ
jgi:outer membrane lipoprotein-sorting protein